MALLLNSAGTPEPSPEIRRRLQAVHPGLDLKFNIGTPAHWMVTMAWPENDRRWGMVQRQEIGGGASYSILGWLPLDCPIDQAPNYLERFLRTATEDSTRDLLAHVSRYNTEVLPAAQVDEALQAVLGSGSPIGDDRVAKKGKRTLHKTIS